MLNLHFANLFLAHVSVSLSKSKFWKEKLKKFILIFWVDKIDEIHSHVTIALYQPLIPHVALALSQFLFLGTHVAALAGFRTFSIASLVQHR